MIVVDASVLVNAIGDDGPAGQLARTEIRAAGSLSAPDLIDVEVVNVLRKLWLKKALTARRFSNAVDDLLDLPMDRYPALPFVRRAYELRSNVTAYDATYVALAEQLSCELLTVDGRLSRASGVRCPIRELTVALAPVVVAAPVQPTSGQAQGGTLSRFVRWFHRG